MKTVMLMGAGVSRAARTGKTKAKQPPLDTDFFEIAVKIYPKQTRAVLDCLENLVGDYSAVLSKSLETAATYLYIKAIDSNTGSEYHIGFLRLLELLNRVLAQTTNDIKTGPRSILYRMILSELKKLEKPENLTIITFNYDLLLERVLEDIDIHGHPSSFWFPGCYRFSDPEKIQSVAKVPQFETENYNDEGIALLKLHGSLSWQSVHQSEKPTPSAMFSTKRKIQIMDSTRINSSLTWKRRKRRVYLKPVIVPPISGKRGMLHEDLLPIWSHAAKSLREADRVVISGYSCPPLDLEARILLSENLRFNDLKKVYVVDPNPSLAASYAEICGVNHVTVYTSIEDWLQDAI